MLVASASRLRFLLGGLRTAEVSVLAGLAAFRRRSRAKDVRLSGFIAL